ncbi:MAG: amidohydrolase family protein [Gemmatimonadetes bacterium]|nr:amidohydrolase family protein [Gemmatimonadota bacterium]
MDQEFDDRPRFPVPEEVVFTSVLGSSGRQTSEALTGDPDAAAAESHRPDTHDRPMHRTLIPILGLGLTVACGSPPQTASLAIHDVTVIDPLSRQVLPDHSVFVSEGRIVGVEPAGGAAFLATDSLDGSGRFVIPGLMDMHVHLFRDARVARPTLNLLLANGITGFREMASDCWDATVEHAFCTDSLRELTRDVAAGGRTTPRPLAMSSLPINGVSQRGGLPEGAPEFLAPGTADDGRTLAQWLNARQIDVVKVYNSVPRDAYFALLDEATGLDMEVSGHLPLSVSVVEASNAGHRTIEHARDLPVACGSYSDTYRKVMARVVAGDDGVNGPSAFERIRATLDAFDESVCAAVLTTLAANGTYLVPTHGTREMDYLAGDSAYRANDRLRYVLPPIREGWEADLDRTAGASDDLVEMYGEFYALGVRLSGMAHATGVKVMAGTDSNDTMIIPGFALHDELARFVESGMSPMDALRTATATPAEYLDRSGDLGTISVGAVADLLLLNADPLADIANTLSIEAVLVGGRVQDRATLDELLVSVEAAVSAWDGGADP